MSSESDIVPFQPPPDGHFTPGFDPRRARGRGRPSLLDDPEKIELFAKSLADGASVKEMSEIFNCTERSVRTYKKDPRVKAVALKFIEERVLEITRRTDSIIAARLRNADKFTIEELLKIRKEFLGGAMRLQTTGGDAKDDKTINDAMEAMEANPELAEKLAELMNQDSLSG